LDKNIFRTYIASMLFMVTIAVCILALAFSPSVEAFSSPYNRVVRASSLSATVQDKQTIGSVNAPDFYWEYRLNRLAKKKGSDLSFSEDNYPDVSGFKNLYDAYYLDLTLQGKLEDFDWESEKKISDSEWQEIYTKISEWSSKTAIGGTDTSSLPSNDFDLLKNFYPQLNFRDLEDSFAPEEVGAGFPYNNMKDMLQAALDGTLSVPGYSSDITSLDASNAKAQLAALKESSMAKIDTILSDSMSYATSPFPDDAAKEHYKKLKTTLGDFPQGAAAWAKFREEMDKEVDEMAKLAAKKVDPHHHGEEPKMSPAEEFEAKYGRNLDEMQERMNQYKSDPQGFLENAIVEKYGQKGLDVWKKSEEFSSKLGTMSDSDKTAAEATFSKFLDSA